VLTGEATGEALMGLPDNAPGVARCALAEIEDSGKSLLPVDSEL
jgi:hypothetical protein